MAEMPTPEFPMPVPATRHLEIHHSPILDTRNSILSSVFTSLKTEDVPQSSSPPPLAAQA